GSGNKTLSYTITKGDKVCEIVDGKFRLEEVGQWTLTCTAVDYVGTTKEAKCVLNGVVGDKPILMDEPNLPKAYVSGSVYELPVLYAYDYSSGTQVRKSCDVSVTCNGKTATYKSGESFVPAVENHGESITVAYTCDGETVFERNIPGFIVFGRERIPGATERYRDVINVEKYFYTEDALTFTNKYKLANVSGLKISADKETDSAKMSFINPQMENGFSLSFFTVPNESKFSSLRLTLTDSVNSNISLRVDLVKDETQTLMVVGDTVLALAVDFDAAVATPFSIGFDKNNFIVNETTSVAVSKTESGDVFDGFPSGKVYFDIEMQNAAEGAAIFLNKIGSINVSNTLDNTGPSIATKENIVANAFKDSVYTVQRVFACDVLCPNSEALLTVIDPNGEVVTSLDGILLSGVDATRDYQIKLTAYGNYAISVVATEAKGWKEPRPNESYFSYGVTVTDGEAPTIAFEKDFAKNLKVGETLIIPKYTVADNHSTAEEITVIKMIINPKGMPVYLYGESNGIRCEYAGLYQIKIYVYDTMGNLTVVEKTVSVQ
ncbi:MAG: hypothetical protein IJD33_00645, partial [Clostridia bacterium]|nr:hypothetical protein [Clostridia bacterium]